MKHARHWFIALCLAFGVIAAPEAHAQSERTTVILSVPAYFSTNRDYFRRVDLATGQFVGRPVLYEVNTFTSLDFSAARTQINGDNRERLVALARKQFPPGDYVWVSSYRTIGMYAHGAQTEVCHFQRSPVFRFEPGATPIVRTDHIAFHELTPDTVEFRSNTSITDEQVMGEYQRTRARRPELSADAAFAEPVAFIAWDIDRDCGRAETFRTLPAETAPQ